MSCNRAPRDTSTSLAHVTPAPRDTCKCPCTGQWQCRCRWPWRPALSPAGGRHPPGAQVAGDHSLLLAVLPPAGEVGAVEEADEAAEDDGGHGGDDEPGPERGALPVPGGGRGRVLDRQEHRGWHSTTCHHSQHDTTHYTQQTIHFTQHVTTHNMSQWSRCPPPRQLLPPPLAAPPLPLAWAVWRLQRQTSPSLSVASGLAMVR